MSGAVSEIAERIRSAAREGLKLRIRGGGTKDFYGNLPRGEPLETASLSGIVAYEPSELVLVVCAGTPLRDLEGELAGAGQMLAFEPPCFGDAATVGGCVAAGLAGPRRATAGGVRDAVLGARLIDGRGASLAFGGKVVKNVAGYDVSRVLAGSLGTLGVITEVSLKVVPRPQTEATLRFDLDENAALDSVNGWLGRPLPISASTWFADSLWLRLSGSEAAVRAARITLGGEAMDSQEAKAFWQSVREQRHDFFAGKDPLWRISVPPTTPSLQLRGAQLHEWSGALRWLRMTAPVDDIRAVAGNHGGHATLFRGGERSNGVFAPLAPAIAAIHLRLLNEFDPQGVFDRGRLLCEDQDAHQ